MYWNRFISSWHFWTWIRKITHGWDKECYIKKIATSTPICAIRLSHPNSLTIHTILFNIYYQSNKIQFFFFIMVGIWMNKEIPSFVIQFWPKVICMGREESYSQRQPDCPYYQCSLIFLSYYQLLPACNSAWPGKAWEVEMTQMRKLIKRHDFMNGAAESNTLL